MNTVQLIEELNTLKALLAINFLAIVALAGYIIHRLHIAMSGLVYITKIQEVLIKAFADLFADDDEESEED